MADTQGSRQALRGKRELTAVCRKPGLRTARHPSQEKDGGEGKGKATSQGKNPHQTLPGLTRRLLASQPHAYPRACICPTVSPPAHDNVHGTLRPGQAGMCFVVIQPGIQPDPAMRLLNSPAERDCPSCLLVCGFGEGLPLQKDRGGNFSARVEVCRANTVLYKKEVIHKENAEFAPLRDSSEA